MTLSTEGDAARLKARIAGVLYLGTMVSGALDIAVSSSVIVHGDAAATAAKIMASEPLFRLGFVADLLGGAFYVGVTAILYDLLKPVSRTVSMTAAFFSLVGCAVGAACAVDLLAPVTILSGGASLNAFTPSQLQALALTALRLHALGYTIAMVFFGVYCALLGYLTFRSSFFPRLLGVLLMLAGLGWLADTTTAFLWPSLQDAVSPVSMALGFVGEGSLMLWLLVVGVNAPKWQSAALAAEAMA